QEAVEHGGGDGGVAEDLSPGGDAAVGGQDDAGLEVALGHDLEQRGGCFTGQGEVAELVDDEQGGAGEEPHGGRPAALDRRAVAAGGEVGGGGEVDPVAGLSGSPAKADGKVGLPDTWWSD